MSKSIPFGMFLNGQRSTLLAPAGKGYGCIAHLPGLDAAGIVGAEGGAMLVAAAPAAAAAVDAYFVRVPAAGDPPAAASEEGRGGCH
eukprot:COSAG04_NODE_12302_length_659_cov_0.916071_1_plen_86_part_10